jgi:hypothetical protein
MRPSHLFPRGPRRRTIRNGGLFRCLSHRKAGETFLANLDSITVEQMCETAEKAHVLDDEKVSGDFVS